MAGLLQRHGRIRSRCPVSPRPSDVTLIPVTPATGVQYGGSSWSWWYCTDTESVCFPFFYYFFFYFCLSSAPSSSHSLSPLSSRNRPLSTITFSCLPLSLSLLPLSLSLSPPPQLL
ncbi:hypothetical protein BO94DRAFT_363830 [Aspergillus sclerotioniger CBS 115572]|uniref:Uncharacterized protein n=1 Tax=Aspergillus sclerotioniger CBS 115572 TaxID=1450535 RepID=A0A317X4G0_9EURO|nr:hypothetical protein BO94DRAFT_363830 [Aspergillus sclerotioniger CBS 115572]PWY93235.1 hypothetical protein BO94DRAFT_363830 [Aspergillus sclerotioniger CBS 115572]